MSYRLIDIMQRNERDIEKEREREKKIAIHVYIPMLFFSIIVAPFYLDFNRI